MSACRSDVWQTWRLWKLWEQNGLMIPTRRRRQVDPDDLLDVGPGHHAPVMPVCPRCGDVNTIELIDMDEGEMSEAEASDYEAGLWGVQYCTTCRAEFDYGF